MVTPPITYYWTVPLILDHSYLVGKQVRKLLMQKCQDFRGSKAFVSAIFEFVKFATRYRMSGPILGDLSNNRCSGGIFYHTNFYQYL